MKSEVITCDICGAKYERHDSKGEVVRTYYLRFPSFYPCGNARDGKCLELDLCGKCATEVSAMEEAVKKALNQTLEEMKESNR